MTAATASRYCSRNKESPSIVLNERPSRLESYHNGRGYDPVIAVGRIMSRVVVSISVLRRFRYPNKARPTGRAALGERLGCPVVTADQAWAQLEIGVEIILIR